MGLFSAFKKNKKNENKEANTAPAKATNDEAVKEAAEAKPDKAKAPAANPKAEAAKATTAKADEKKDIKPEAKKTAKNAADKPEPKAKKAEAAADKKETAKAADKADKKPSAKAAPQKKEAAKSASKTEPKAATKAEPKAAVNAEAKPEAADAPSAASEKITGRFEIKKAKDGRYVFNLYASNHVIVATSQVYSSTQSALVGINSVIANAHKAPIEDQTQKSYQPYGYPKWEMYIDKGQQYRFRLYAANGSCICHSQGYTSKTNCKNGIDSIIRSSRNAEIDKSYLKKEDK